ncbi:MAG: MerR family transcriptional regulator [Chloroflexi bacterium AL-W]|nr:MerR family transcriptional regulator [Chloroflexi bacterium AL-N1]NOK70120.1 MerR family transcriptional regulator [Chloroflexi bacterium AL-N10]NOK77868.1 MerR family transcriptional regulator [Chloroflexi bacterium AL-N5]NOK84877.1 MerR family transcriptional regulator [Chloroflexi bacterium AL-W]NOK91856.1 MerR family transcriptional regulator [Chloroflexi bacterium AL-N15]
MYTIGQLSKATNVTPRTLRHYHELGLLTPSKIGESGYRYYSADAIVKLHHILVLKELGFSLTKIKAIVAHDKDCLNEAHWSTAIQKQIDMVRQEQQRFQALEKILQTTFHAITMHGTIQLEDILLFVQSIHPANEQQQHSFLQSTFHKNEIAILKNLPRMDTQDPRTRRWVQLIREVREHMHLPPDSSVIQDIAVRIIDCARDFFQGNEELVQKYWSLIRPDPGQPNKVYGMDTALMDYIDQIIDWHYTHGAGKEEHIDD